MRGAGQTRRVALHPSVEQRLARLAPDQRAAATAPPGPVLCVAPAGSGKTTTLVARIAWLVDSGTPADAICAVTFNKRAADELEGRLVTALEPLGVGRGGVRVRTFHALGREILASAQRPVEPLVDRGLLLRRLYPRADRARLRQLDDRFSRLKLNRNARLEDVEADPAAIEDGPAFVAYELAVRETGGLDFDDLVVHALRLLEDSPDALERWRASCGALLVDEVQDVDRTQLRLALHLAAPGNRIFLVGDDDQSIYGWRLADVRRILALDEVLPGLRRIDLVTNYRCPAPVVRRAVRLIEANHERFRKEIRPGPAAGGLLMLAPDSGGGEAALRRFLTAPLAPGTTRAVLARTNRELMLPLAIALDLGLGVRSTARLLVEAPNLDALLDRLAAGSGDPPLLLRLRDLRDRCGEGASGAGVGATARSPAAATGAGGATAAAAATGVGGATAATTAPIGDASAAIAAAMAGSDTGGPSAADVASGLLAWGAAHQRDDVRGFVARIRAARVRLAELRSDDAPLILATAHGTKGLEFDEVAVIGLDEGRFPSERTLAEAEDPVRALEEERRLAYVAWTRAKRLLVLIYDPMRPSPFLLEAFSREELNLPPGAGLRPEPVGVARRGTPSHSSRRR